eukprot:719160-Pyramimonas_sp.AAC.1
MAIEKLGMTATSGPLLKRAEQVLGKLGGGDAYSVPHLGIDFAGGKPRRGCSHLQLRKKRA